MVQLSPDTREAPDWALIQFTERIKAANKLTSLFIIDLSFIYWQN